MRWLVRLYPRAWRDEYGPELEDILEREPVSLRTALDVVLGALDARLQPEAWVRREAATPGGRVTVSVFGCRRDRFALGLSVGYLLAVMPAVAVLNLTDLRAWALRQTASSLLLYVGLAVFLVLASSRPRARLGWRPGARASLVAGAIAAVVVGVEAGLRTGGLPLALAAVAAVGAALVTAAAWWSLVRWAPAEPG